MNKSAANTPPTGAESAANEAKKQDAAPENNEIRFAFVPIVREFRGHTKKNEARLWIPVETSLLVRYEFASCSLQTRYIFVAIVLFCGANGIEEIPLDAKFMSSVLVADERTIAKSFDELLQKKLLVERKEREIKKEQTDRQATSDDGAVCVGFENLFQEIAEEEKPKTDNGLLKTDDNLLKIVPPVANANAGGKQSLYSIEECLKYVEVCQSKGERIESPRALAAHLHKTGEADAFIMATLYPQRAAEIEREQYGAPVKFTDEPCRVCFGAKMADADGRGFRKCAHCRNERGKSTGFEPEES